MNTKVTKSLNTKVADVNTKGIVTIQITQFDKYDSDNDRLLKGALNKTWSEGSQVHLVDHKMGTSTFVGLPIKRDAETGIIESKLNLNKQVGIDLLADYEFSQENGRSLQHSHGFAAVKGKYKENEKGGFDFSEVKQFEYSTVLFGAVSDTPLHSIKSEKDLKETIELIKSQLAFGNYSEEYLKLLEDKLTEFKSMLIEPSNHSNEFKNRKPSADTFDISNAIKNL